MLWCLYSPWMKAFIFQFNLSQFFASVLIDNKPTLISMITLYWTNNRPLHKTVIMKIIHIGTILKCVFFVWAYKLWLTLAPGKFEWNFRYVVFKWILVIADWGISCENCTNMNVTGLHWWSFNIGSGNGLVPSGNKPLPEPMLTQTSVAIWSH